MWSTTYNEFIRPKMVEDCVITFDYRYATQNESLTDVIIRQISASIPTFTDLNQRYGDVDNDKGYGYIDVTTSIDTDTPATGIVYIGSHDSYEYTSWTNTGPVDHEYRYTLSETLRRDYTEEIPVYIVTEHGQVTIPAGTRGYCQVLFNDNNLIHDIKNLVVSSDSNKRLAESQMYVGAAIAPTGDYNGITDTKIKVKVITTYVDVSGGTVTIGDGEYAYTSFADDIFTLSEALTKDYTEDDVVTTTNINYKSTLTVKTSISTETPQTGTVYIGDRSTHSVNDSYEYTSWVGKTYILSSALTDYYAEDLDVYTINNDKLQDIKIYCLGDNGMKLLYGFNNEVVREVTEVLQKAFLVSPPECPLCEGTGEYPEGLECPDCNGYKFSGSPDINDFNWLYKQKAAEVGVYPLNNEGNSFQWLTWAKKWWITPTIDRIKEYIGHFLRIETDKITIDEHYGYTDDQGVFQWREVYWVVRIPITSSSGENVAGDIIPTDDFTLQSLIYNVTPAGISVIILEYSELYEGDYTDYCDDYQTPATYTLNGEHTVANDTVTVVEAIDENTPQNSAITLTSSTYPYRYVKWVDKVFYLTDNLLETHATGATVTVGEWTICPKQINHGCIFPALGIDNNGFSEYGARFDDQYFASLYFDISPYTNFEEYTGAASSGTSIVVSGDITEGTRSNGKISIQDATNTEEAYYSSWTGSTFTLESALSNSYTTGIIVYVGRHELADDPVTYTDSNGTGDDYIRVKGVMDSPAPPNAGWLVIGGDRYEYGPHKGVAELPAGTYNGSGDSIIKLKVAPTVAHASGTISIDGEDYTYVSWATTEFTLSGTLTRDYDEDDIIKIYAVETGTTPDYTKFRLTDPLEEDHSENENVYIDHFYDDNASASITNEDYIEKYLLRDQPWIYLEE